MEYFIALFVDTPALLKEKLNGFMSADSSEAWLVRSSLENPLLSLENLPPNKLNLYEDCWYIHGSPRFETSDRDFPGFPMVWNFYTREQISIEKIDDALHWFAARYLWSVFPYAGPDGFSCFAFLSANCELRDRFLNVSSNYKTKMTLYYKLSEDLSYKAYSYPEPGYSNCFNWYDVNLLISNYHVKNHLSEVLRAIIFLGDETCSEKGENAAGRIWDSCKCDLRPPWMIIVDSEEDEDEDEEDKLPLKWEKANLQFIQYFTVELIEHPDYNPDYILPQESLSLKLGIYQPLDRASFMLMCTYQLCFPDILLAVPHGTDIERLKSLLAKTEGYLNYSDLCYIPDILNITDWLYAFNRTNTDFGDSLFVAKDSAILRKIDEFNRDDGYCLISCF